MTLFVVIQSTGSVLAMTSSTAGNPQTTMDHEGTIDAEALRQAVAESFDKTIGQLTDLVAIPGIAWPSFDPAPLNRSADAVASLVRASGFDDVRILRCDKEDGTPGGPAVVARRPAAEASRQSCCTPTTTSSPPATWHCGKPTPLPPSSATAGSSAAVPPMTRPASWRTSPPTRR